MKVKPKTKCQQCGIPNATCPADFIGEDGSRITGTDKYDSAGMGYQRAFGLCEQCIDKANDEYEAMRNDLYIR